MNKKEKKVDNTSAVVVSNHSAAAGVATNVLHTPSTTPGVLVHVSSAISSAMGSTCNNSNSNVMLPLTSITGNTIHHQTITPSSHQSQQSQPRHSVTAAPSHSAGTPTHQFSTQTPSQLPTLSSSVVGVVHHHHNGAIIQSSHYRESLLSNSLNSSQMANTAPSKIEPH